MKHLDRGHSKDFSAHSARSYGLSNSFFGNESSFKKDIKELSTGLKLSFDENIVNMVLKADKPNLMLIEYTNRHLKRLGINTNFEQVEIMLIADFLLYIILFAKEELWLSDYKTVILLAIMEALLKTDNPAYDLPPDPKEETVYERQEKTMEKQSTANIELKTLENDLNAVKMQLVDHSINNPPTQQKIFEPMQVARILGYIQKSYAEKFSLYKYIFMNKKKNEEIKLNVCIDRPLTCAPLCDALYMGYDYQPILDGKEEIEEYKHCIEYIKQKKTLLGELDESMKGMTKNVSFATLSMFKAMSGRTLGNDTSKSSKKILAVVDPEEKLITEKFGEFKATVNANLAKVDEELENVIEAITDPKSKKKR